MLKCAGGREGLLASKATEMSVSCSAQCRPSQPFALRRADLPIVCAGFGFDRFCLNRISFVRASGETLKRRVCDRLEGYIGLLFPSRTGHLAPLFCSTSLERFAERPDLICPWFVRVLDSKDLFTLRYRFVVI